MPIRGRFTLEDLGVSSRRGFLKTAGTAVAGVGAVVALPRASRPRVRTDAITGWKIKDLTGPSESGPYGAAWTDLGIPARCPNGSLFLLCGDTFDGATNQQGNWLAPVGLRSSNASLDGITVDGSVGGNDAHSLVKEPHTPVQGGRTTAIPSDVFTIGNTMYMHLMRGVIYQTDHSDFWKSTDNGETWTSLCQWPGSQYGGQFQQKTYAVANDGNCYVYSSVFNRTKASGLLLHRVPQSRLGEPDAYQPWGYANGSWGWGNAPTSISPTTHWGEICFRAMGGKYGFTWFDPDSGNILAQVCALPTSNLFTTPKQTLIYHVDKNSQTGNKVAAPYGGFIIPGSTFDTFDIAVSQYYDNTNYRVMHYRISGLAH